MRKDFILDALGPPARTGRPGFPARALLRAVLCKYTLGVRFTVEMLERLKASPKLRQLCGFGDRLPSESTMSRFNARLKEVRGDVKRCLDIVTERLKDELARLEGDYPPLGETVAVDSTAVNAFANPNRKVIADPDARWGVKHGARTTEGKTEFFFGYKLHMIADANYGAPLDFIVTPGNENDSIVLPGLLQQARDNLQWFKPVYVIGDRGV